MCCVWCTLTCGWTGGAALALVQRFGCDGTDAAASPCASPLTPQQRRVRDGSGVNDGAVAVEGARCTPPPPPRQPPASAPRAPARLHSPESASGGRADACIPAPHIAFPLVRSPRIRRLRRRRLTRPTAHSFLILHRIPYVLHSTINIFIL